MCGHCQWLQQTRVQAAVSIVIRDDVSCVFGGPVQHNRQRCVLPLPLRVRGCVERSTGLLDRLHGRLLLSVRNNYTFAVWECNDALSRRLFPARCHSYRLLLRGTYGLTLTPPRAHTCARAYVRMYPFISVPAAMHTLAICTVAVCREGSPAPHTCSRMNVRQDRTANRE